MIHEIQEGYVKVEPKSGVTTIEFYHPRGNSLPSAMLADLTQEIHSAGLDEDIKVLLQNQTDVLISLVNKTELEMMGLSGFPGRLKESVGFFFLVNDS